MTDQISKRRVGLLGGSFNPAHEGHLHVSDLCFDLLGLDEVWWLVSPQNPLKSSKDMASLQDRMAAAVEVAKAHKNIVISDAESQLGTRYTVDTLTALKAEHLDCDFVWIMGADNLRQMLKWKDWRTIFSTVPIAVFPRAPYSLRSMRSRAARSFADWRIPTTQAKDLIEMQAPAWVFLKAPTHGQSATKIRRKNVL